MHLLHHSKHPHPTQHQIEIRVSQHTLLGQPVGRQNIRGEQHALYGITKNYESKEKKRKIISRWQRLCF